jgi:hypothetical protein
MEISDWQRQSLQSTFIAMRANIGFQTLTRTSDTEEDIDGDQVMLTATHNSQFTQQLMLFVRSFFLQFDTC